MRDKHCSTLLSRIWVFDLRLQAFQPGLVASGGTAGWQREAAFVSAVMSI
jgi:hypothetical protein